MAIKAVIFDCFGVLVAAAETTLFDAFPQHRAELRALDIRDNLGEFTGDEFINQVSAITGKQVEELIKNHYCNVDIRTRDQAAIDWAVQLKGSGEYKIGLLSNVGHDWLNRFLHDMGEVGLFDQMILSCDVAIMKPDPAIFEMMAKKFGLAPNECVMIDDKAENIAGAAKAGMHGIVFSSTAQAKAEFDKILKG